MYPWSRTFAASPPAARALALGCCLALAGAVTAEARGFRGVAWGATPEEVRAAEKLPLHHDLEHEIAYWNFEFAGVEAGLVYAFEAGRLVEARYVSRHATDDPAEDLADYESFRATLDEHFGTHVVEEWVWADGEARGAPEDPLRALTSGAAKLVSSWRIEGSRLELLIAGSDGAVRTVRAIFRPPAS